MLLPNRWLSRALRPAAAAILAAAALSAHAHHGWSWAEEAQSELAGTVQRVEVSPPHPWLDVRVADGTVWRVELGNPVQTERSGFTAASAKAGDTVKALGNRDKDAAKHRMKAVRIEVGGKTYDIYPERIHKH
ncbi:DUF6152 family protein [Paracidovorax anthurii]|uniref:DUF5666 domain-containing protein n=1 Tax=Paracidovorax anthurii TaxID=78229 RepID=A0A328YWB4_9BURK|nr:DUF6152 family protein [Paracidovorax anthurii]RAR77694.1 hypothetical protein AX018_103532 [Paracidovorax anthurii]